MTKYRILLISLAALVFSFAAGAKNISEDLAARVAANLYIERAGIGVTAKSIKLEKAIPYSQGSQILFYIFNVSEKQGFVIVAADDRSTPILGYSLSGGYGQTATPPAFDWLLLQYSKQIQTIITENIPATETINTSWKHLSSLNFKPALSKLLVLPMLTTTWDQGCKYNDSCPVDQSSWSCNKAVTGCVATALAQIIKYHNFPANGSGRHSYVHPTYGILHADYGATTYNWSSMPNTLNNPSAAVAQLMFHCGVGVEMNYGPQESGAPSSNVALTLIHFFNYDQGAHIIERADYNDTDWTTLIRNELNYQRPVYYAGFDPSAGHAFVCDGFQNTDYFHFNWGWSGSYDGYFYLNNLNPGGSYAFNNSQEAVIGIKPGVATPCSGTTTLTAWEGDFTDGSYASNYQNNASCQWLIQPDNNPAYVSLEFMNFKTELINDVVNVYDGTSTSSPLLGTYSGYTIPPVINSTGNTLLVEFISNSSSPNKGWSARYTGHFCYPTATLTQPNGTFSDGSGTLKYNNMTDCYWLIQQPANTQIALMFNSFETEQDYDFVTVYNGSDTTAPELGSFSGNTMPPTLLSTGNTMLVHFNADAGVTATGWEATYTTSVGIPKEGNSITLSVFPNPAHANLMVRLPESSDKSRIEMRDVCGKLVKATEVLPHNSISTIVMDIQTLSPGCYFISVDNKAGHDVVRCFIR